MITRISLLWYCLNVIFPLLQWHHILPSVYLPHVAGDLCALKILFIKLNSFIKYNLLLEIKWFLFVCCVFFIHIRWYPTPWRLFKHIQLMLHILVGCYVYTGVSAFFFFSLLYSHWILSPSTKLIFGFYFIFLPALKERDTLDNKLRTKIYSHISIHPSILSLAYYL